MSSALRRLDPWPLLRGAPIALPQLLALLALITLSAGEGGYPLEHWAPAAVIVHLLLLVALITLPARSPSAWSRAAIALVVAYGGWTVLSISWADDQGAAAIAATRTAMMVSTFALFTRWRHAPSSALAVLTAAVAGLGVLTWGVVIALLAETNIDPWFLFDRLLEPVGYVNASAAFWGFVAFTAAGLISGRIGLGHRLIGAAVAPPAAALSILALSRGGLLAAAIVIVLLLALLPGRARNAAGLAIPGLAVLIALPQLLDVGDVLRTFGTPLPSPEDPAAVLDGALIRLIAGTLLAVAATFAWARADAALPSDDPRRTRAARGGAAALAATATLATVAVLAGLGPVTTTRIGDAIDSITEPYQATEVGESRLSAGLSSGRWDFWTVAWAQFERAPLIGAGADNYRQDFLLEGQGLENPRFPHSLWLRQLGQLGLVGFALLLGWLATIAIAIRRLAAGSDPAARAIAVAAAGGVGLWVVHGSVDWLQEYAGFTAIVAAVAGLAVAAGRPARQSGATAAPSAPDEDATTTDAAGTDVTDAGEATATPARRAVTGRIATAAAVALLLLLSGWTAAQWTAERDRLAASALAADQPGRAHDRADRARALDPFGEQPDLLLGALAVRRGDLDAARAAYARAYDRNPRATPPRLWLGVLASSTGDARQARRWLRAAGRSAPRDPLPAELLSRVRAGEQLDPQELQRVLAERRRALITDPEHPTS